MAQCKKCNVPLETAPSWEWKDKSFSREICNLCGFKSKAFVVPTQTTAFPVPTLPATST